MFLNREGGPAFEQKGNPWGGDDRKWFPQGLKRGRKLTIGYKRHVLYPTAINIMPHCGMSSTFYVR